MENGSVCPGRLYIALVGSGQQKSVIFSLYLNICLLSSPQWLLNMPVILQISDGFLKLTVLQATNFYVKV